MADQYEVHITMSVDTVTKLSDNNFVLCGFRVVQASSGSPLVWFQTTDFAVATTVAWTEGYRAYVSQTKVTAGVTLTAENPYPIAPGQTLTITDVMGVGEVSDSDATGLMQQGISIVNQTFAPFTCGLLQQQPSGAFSPVCALPLFGNNMEVIVPVEQVFLMFSSLPVQTGAVQERAYGPGILIDLADSKTRSVTYEIDHGWSWEEMASWARSCLPDHHLTPLLIQPLTTPDPK